jgi:hypothetical protein
MNRYEISRCDLTPWPDLQAQLHTAVTQLRTVLENRPEAVNEHLSGLAIVCDPRRFPLFRDELVRIRSEAWKRRYGTPGGLNQTDPVHAMAFLVSGQGKIPRRISVTWCDVFAQIARARRSSPATVAARPTVRCPAAPEKTTTVIIECPRIDHSAIERANREAKARIPHVPAPAVPSPARAAPLAPFGPTSWKDRLFSLVLFLPPAAFGLATAWNKLTRGDRGWAESLLEAIVFAPMQAFVALMMWGTFLALAGEAVRALNRWLRHRLWPKTRAPLPSVIEKAQIAR